MRRTLLTLTFTSLLVAMPALAQQQVAKGDYVSNSDVVLAVKERLSQLGYNVTPDGNFDAELRNNVLLFQSKNGLRPTGNVDLSTIDTLGIDLQPTGRRLAAGEGIPQQAAEAHWEIDPRFPILRDEAMQAPQVAGQPELYQRQSGTAIPQAESELSEAPAGIPHEALSAGWD